MTNSLLFANNHKMPTIHFILTSLYHPRCHKRIKEFVTNGYKVRVFGFEREGIPPSFENEYYEIHNIGTIGKSNYLKRLFKLQAPIQSVISQMNNNDILYLFGLDLSIVCYLYRKGHRFIFEESDLMHTYINNKLIKWVLEKADIFIIRKSLFSVFTSEGFLKYHFESNFPNNTIVIPNKLDPAIKDIEIYQNKECDTHNLHFGFVGDVRFVTIANFARCVGQRFPQHIFHFFGIIMPKEMKRFESLKVYKNIIFHGKYNNLTDLSNIYSQIDLCVSTYDIEFDNVRYAEPNKLYECLFFNTPLVVSKDTFLAKKVERLKIGFVVDATNVDSISKFISNLTQEDIETKKQAIKQYPKKLCINDNSQFFREIADSIKNKSVK